MREPTYKHDNEYYYQILRKNIRKYRKAQNLTQQDLADMTDMSREYICDIENESRRKHVTVAVLGRIAEALGTPIGKFFEG
ncbi:helix-turn-helix transcriptional regulator [Candidatus Saccharibacteria bacterium]|nr:helix-turn-helix transcriptional regulator [Candidatus Saccharibacteria bacterium]